MRNRGQTAPFWNWIEGLILLFILLITYEFMSPTVETQLPLMANYTTTNPYVYEINNSTVSAFKGGALMMGFGYVIYLFIAPFIGQREETQYEF